MIKLQKICLLCDSIYWCGRPCKNAPHRPVTDNPKRVTDNLKSVTDNPRSVTDNLESVTDNLKSVTDKICIVCNKAFPPKRVDATVCSPACRMRKRRTKQKDQSPNG